MKKIFTLLVTLIMCLSLCACGNESANNKKNDESKNSVELKIGETAITDKIEFVLTKVDFGEVLCNSMDDEYLMAGDYSKTVQGVNGEVYDNPYVAEDGKILVPFSFDIKYIGKEEVTFTVGDGISLIYGDGYTFDSYNVYIKKDGEWEQTVETEGASKSTYFTKFEPLDSTVYECRGYFEVPIEVMENSEEPLKMEVMLLGETYTYIIR